MLYGFRSELAEDISRQGYHFTIYVPYGNDWFGYFMRRLAERPQNLALAYQEFVSTKTLKKIGVFTQPRPLSCIYYFWSHKIIKR